MLAHRSRAAAIVTVKPLAAKRPHQAVWGWAEKLVGRISTHLLGERMRRCLKTTFGTNRTSGRVRFSNRPVGVKHFQAIHRCNVDVTHGLALLFGNGTKALPSWGSEDEAEQSIRRPYRLTNGRSKRTNELTSSIVPRGTSFHRSVELECPPIGSDLARLSCRCRG